VLLFHSKNLGLVRSRLKNRILVQDRGGAEFHTGGILLYVEDLKRGTNKDIGPKDIFEMASVLSATMPGNFNSSPATSGPI
jgi:hypothetical protein